MRITSKGQVTIPQAVRERTGLLPNTEVEFIVEGTDVRAVRRLSEHGRAVTMTTDEIMALTRADG
jgi:AbrB family looped-hinge helix DNA binding protein